MQEGLDTHGESQKLVNSLKEQAKEVQKEEQKQQKQDKEADDKKAKAEKEAKETAAEAEKKQVEVMIAAIAMIDRRLLHRQGRRLSW